MYLQYLLLHLFMHWGDAKKPFLIQLGGVAVFLLRRICKVYTLCNKFIRCRTYCKAGFMPTIFVNIYPVVSTVQVT